MPHDDRRRQAALQRKAARRKDKRKGQQSASPALRSERAVYQTAGRWPLHEVLLARDWQDVGQITQIIVARRSPSGEVAAGVFLVDLGLLGVKNAFGSMFGSVGEYERTLRARIAETQPLVSADLDLAAKIIQEAIAYARRYGFEPNRDYPEAAAVLAGADPAAAHEPVPHGRDGKPFYVSGPNDDVPRIVARLAKAAGPGNFDYVAHLLAPTRRTRRLQPDDIRILGPGEPVEEQDDEDDEEDDEDAARP